MKRYTVKYRQPGQLFWRRIHNVVGDGIERNFRFFLTEEDDYISISINAEVIFDKQRNEAILYKLENCAGQPLGRAK